MIMIELFIEESYHRRIAIKEDGLLQDFYIEEKNKDALSGDLFLGIIKKKVKALNAVFIDLGLNKNGFLYLSKESDWDSYKEGQSILVEILKEEEGSKGAKVTDKISIGGKYVVLFPGRGIQFSKKIKKEDFLQRHGDQKPVEGFKILFREAGMEASSDDIEVEKEDLIKKFQQVLLRAETGQGPRKLYGDSSILDRVIRDRFHSLQMIYVDSEEVRDFLKSEYGLPSLQHKGERSLFDFYGINSELFSLNKKQIPLKEGGNLVIEETEALVVIDVNSAQHVKSKNKNETALQVNLLAGKEAARQIRLRNLSGIIIIDFIDMKDDRERTKLEEKILGFFQEDPLFSKAYALTELNLMQITRKKKGHALSYYLKEPCGFCQGEGSLLSFSSIKDEMKNEFYKKKNHVEINAYHIILHKSYKKKVYEDLEGFLDEIQANGKEIYLEFKPNMADYFTISPLVFKSQIEEVERFHVKL